jgi:hypothetical protein
MLFWERLLAAWIILLDRLFSKILKFEINKTIILPIVLYGCETWSVTLGEEHRMIENRVLRRIFGPKREEVAKCKCKCKNSHN